MHKPKAPVLVVNDDLITIKPPNQGTHRCSRRTGSPPALGGEEVKVTLATRGKPPPTRTGKKRRESTAHRASLVKRRSVFKAMNGEAMGGQNAEMGSVHDHAMRCEQKVVGPAVGAVIGQQRQATLVTNDAPSSG